jgi:exopolysaccharide biosynthesis polyprenyl glycosylphosphotransferase
MLKERAEVIKRATIAFDALVVGICFFLSFLLRQHFHDFYRLDLIPSARFFSEPPQSIDQYFPLLIILVPLWCMMLYLNGMYGELRTQGLSEIVWIIAKSSFFVIVGFGTLAFLLNTKFVSRLFFIIFIVVSSAVLLVEKLALFSVMHRLRKRGYNYRRLLIVGTGKRAAGIIDRIKKHPEWGLRIMGTIDDEPERKIEKVSNVEVVGDLKDISAIIRDQSIDDVIFVVPRSRLSFIEEAVLACETVGIRAIVAMDLFDLKIARSRHTELDGIPLVSFETTVATEWQLFVKRAIDVIVSGILIIITAPIQLIAAIAIRLTSYGPILFRQLRVGLNGRKFTLYKFRTMYQGADGERFTLEAKNEMNGPVFKIKNDPRVTKVGKILRKLSLDELPQFYNVLAGHMSLVGPRPPIPEEVRKYQTWQRRRLSMRPGMTCLWQVMGRNNVDFDEWMKLDLEYLDNWSLWLDFRIMVKTIPAVLFGSGAY